VQGVNGDAPTVAMWVGADDVAGADDVESPGSADGPDEG
jgi:hypothetical protein